MNYQYITQKTLFKRQQGKHLAIGNCIMFTKFVSHQNI